VTVVGPEGPAICRAELRTLLVARRPDIFLTAFQDGENALLVSRNKAGVPE